MTASRRLHPAWIVLGALTLCLLASTGIRAVFGVYIKPMEAEFGWSRGALSMAAALSLLLLGASGPAQSAAQIAAAQQAGRVSVTEAAQTLPFWLLMSTFFVCGYTSNGMVLTHFMPHALEHNFTPMQASAALGVMGAMNILGTIGSGWLCDRFGRRGPLATYYFLRGLSLLFLLYVWDLPSLHVWAAIFGLNYISTVPPTTTLTANIFGRYSVGELSGWIFFSHQVGSALGAALAGWIFEAYGSYAPAFVSAGLLGIVAPPPTPLIREESVVRPLSPQL